MKGYEEREYNAGKDFTETTDEVNYLFKGYIVNLRKDRVLLPNGKTAPREYVEHRGGVAVLAVDEQGCIPLVRQYRYPLRSHLWEIPAGKLEIGEDPDVAIARELREEAGLEAGSIHPLGRFYATCGYSNEIIRLYLATDLTYVGAHPDEDEFLEIKYFTIDEVYEMCLSGAIEDSKTLVAILKYKALQEKGMRD
ncbi:MAG: NUDIX hydrolase [Clostridia bacterium]|nr:NUDIX hydrolase [Clostridia bacterium]